MNRHTFVLSFISDKKIPLKKYTRPEDINYESQPGYVVEFDNRSFFKRKLGVIFYESSWNNESLDLFLGKNL